MPYQPYIMYPQQKSKNSLAVKIVMLVFGVFTPVVALGIWALIAALS